MTNRALEDVRVVEYGDHVSAPFCGRLLADLGADVIKVEPPGGDPARDRGPFRNGRRDPECGGLFHFLNCGKTGATLDLDDPVDAARFDGLLSESDVLVENTDWQQRDRWLLDFRSLLERHAHLVVVSISPYGRSGPRSTHPGCDLTASAVSSLPLGLGEPDREPLGLPFEQADYQAALHGATAALCALHERRRSGKGQGIDIAAAQVMAYQVGGMHLVSAKLGKPWGRRGHLQRGAIYPTGFFECADGYVCIASQTPRQWSKFLQLMGEPQWAQDEAARDAITLGAVDASPADPHFRAWMAAHTRREMLEIAMDAGIVLGEVNDIGEVLASPQFAFRGFWGELAPDGTPVRAPKPGYLMGATPTRLTGAGPTQGGTGGWARPRSHPAPSPSTEPRGRALEGIRVLDFGWNWAGPMAGQLLADMGAEVIRIETTKRQDMVRFVEFTSYFFCHNNRSKLSATINITKPEGARLVRELARSSDIVMDNFSAGVMARNGLGYDDFRQVRSDIICVSMSMAGQDGPLHAMRGFASIATAYSGLEQMVGYPDRAVGLMSFGLGDTTLAIQGALGALAALHHRERTGEGQFVDVSQIESATATMGEPLVDWQFTGRGIRQLGNTHSSFSPHGLFACAEEGRWLALTVRDTGEWRSLARALGRGDWSDDEELASAHGRKMRADEIESAVVDWCSALKRDRAVEILLDAGVPAAPVLELEERDSDPHFLARGLLLDHAEGRFEPCRIYATPWLFTATPPEMTRPAPALGEHNEYVFRELLDLDDAEITTLTEQGVLV